MLRQFFSTRNFRVNRVKLLYDQTGRFKGSGFVELDNYKEALTAVKQCNGSNLDGKSLLVQVARQ